MSLEDLFRRQLAGGAFSGGRLVVRSAGEELLTLAIGITRNDGTGVPVTPATLFQIMSASKPVVGHAWEL